MPFFSPSLDFSDNGYNATAKSVDGVNIKNTFCSHTVTLLWETRDCAACTDGNEAGSGDVLLPCSSLGWGVPADHFRRLSHSVGIGRDWGPLQLLFNQL